MNCPNCGAENEAGVRFCIECGTPLEDQAEMVPRPVEDDDSDKTILTTVPPVAEDAKTVAVTQEDLAAVAAEIEIEESPPATPEPESPQPDAPTPPPPASPPPPKGSGSSSRSRNIIIVIVVLLVLCCCCATLGIVGAASSDVIEDVLYELSMFAQPFLTV